MCNTSVTDKIAHMAGMKDIFHKAIIFVHEESITIAGDNASGVLTAMLKN
jgi:hypothetical protein